MPADLERQLATYGRWVERRCATELRPPRTDERTGPPDRPARGRREMDIDTTLPVPQPRRRALLAVAACAIAAVGTGGLVLANRQSTTQPSSPLNDSISLVDPPGALFVLPDPADGYDLANGHMSTTPTDIPPAEAFSPTGLILGVADGMGYTALRAISIHEASPLTSGEWETIDTSTGPAYVSSQPATTVAQQRDDRWILVTTRLDREIAIDQLDAVTIDEHDQLQVDPGDDLMVIHRYTWAPEGVGDSTYFEATSADSSLITVETWTASTPLLSAASVADRIEPTQIDGAPAWIATRADPDGTWNGLVWNETPNRVVGVGGHAGIDEIIELANRLHAVDEAAWRAALPGATRD